MHAMAALRSCALATAIAVAASAQFGALVVTLNASLPDVIELTVSDAATSQVFAVLGGSVDTATLPSAVLMSRFDLERYIYEGYQWRLTQVQAVYVPTAVVNSTVLDGFIQLTLSTNDTVNDTQLVVTVTQGSDDVTLLVSVEATPGLPADEATVLMVRMGALAGPADTFHGQGERFHDTQQRGYNGVYDWTEDGSWGFGTEERLPAFSIYNTYIPMPFVIVRSDAAPTQASYLLYVNDTARTSWDFAPGIGAAADPPPPVSHCDPALSTSLAQHAYCDSESARRAAAAATPLSDDSIMGAGYAVTVERSLLSLVLSFRGDPASAAAALTSTVTIAVPNQPDGIPARALIPPPWAFGPWNELDGEVPNITDFTAAAQWFAAHDIPSSCSVDSMHFFPTGDQRGQEAYLTARNANLTSMGYASQAYFNSMIDTRYTTLFADAQAHDVFIRWSNANGTRGGVNDTYLFQYKGAGPNPFFVGVLDFTNPATNSWYGAQLQDALDLGYAGWMLDYGEYVSINISTFGGESGYTHHNAYPLVYQRAVWLYLTSGNASSDALGLARRGMTMTGSFNYAPNSLYHVRSGYMSTQAYNWAVWTGDPMCDWTHHSGLPAQLTAMLNIGIGGVAFVGSDIGGFVWLEPPSQELWLRWAALGVLSGHMHTENGGTSILGLPKTHIHDDAFGTATWRKFAKLRTQLFPYLYTALHEYQATGMPLMRHHVLSFPWDSVAVQQAYQYMFGPSLLVAPVVSQGAVSQLVYLPTLATPDAVGDWIDVGSTLIFDNTTGRYRMNVSTAPIPGGQIVSVVAALDDVPMFARAGSVIFAADPSVATLFTLTSPPAPPGSGRTGAFSRVSYADRSNVSHAWVAPFPLDARCSAAAGAVLATATSWDMLNVKVSCVTAGPGLTVSLSVVDTFAANRTVIVQLPLLSPNSTSKSITNVVYSVDGVPAPMPSAATWSDLVWTQAAAATSPVAAWAQPAFDAPNVAWFRIGAAPSSVARVVSVTVQ